MKATRTTLETRLRNAVLIPSIVAVILTVIGSQLFSWLDYKDTIERAKVDLITKATLVARRISAEYLIGSRGAPHAVAGGLQNDFKLQSIELTAKSPCEFSDASRTCSVLIGDRLTVVAKVDGAEAVPLVLLTSAVPTFRELNPLRSQFWLGLPFLIIIGFATYLQQRRLRKYFLRPINSIIDKTVSGADIPKYWPSEFVRLHAELDDAFQKREQAIIGQIASGVIHDLKTLLQPLSGATQLAAETSEGSAQSKKLEMLFRACQRNLPKMHRILEAVLDGNREIRLQTRPEFLNKTLDAAIRNAVEAAESQGSVQVESIFTPHDVAFAHDPIQLERALTNLIKNGIEAAAQSKDQKSVRVALEQNKDGQVRIVVEDSGSGLPVPLEQLLASRRSSKLRGTGLGLIVSKKIIEAHGGILSSGNADSLSGAKFTVTLSEVRA